MKHRKMIRDVTGVITVLAVSFLIITIMRYAIKATENRIDLVALCVEYGYPDLIKTKNGYYCHKLENGNDVIVSVENLRE